MSEGGAVVSIDPTRIQTSEDLVAQLKALFSRDPRSEMAFASDAEMSSSTVNALINKGQSVPHGETLRKFVEACGQDPVPWLEARARVMANRRKTSARPARAASPSEAGPLTPLGRVIGDLSEHDALTLEVHQAFDAAAAPRPLPVLPMYLQRPGFDDRLREEVAGAVNGTRLVMVVGGSSTGKTRACWEAIRAELPDWRVWHPLAPERPTALLTALRERRVAARTVIWLNEAQDYLQDSAAGEQVAAELQALLADDARGPVLVLGSMWPDYWKVLTRAPEDTAPPHPAARALLDRACELTAPRSFTSEYLAELAATIAADQRLQDAARQAPNGQLTQELAGAPELLRRYRHASPAAQAVLWAAMDARRLGHDRLLPELLLRDAAPGYLDDRTWDQIGGTDWFTLALDELTTPHRKLPGPLIEYQPRPGEPPEPVPPYRLADYLDQHGRRERALIRPPTAFWDAAADHARTPQDLAALGEAAWNRGCYRHGAHLYREAAEAGDSTARQRLTKMQREAAEWDGIEGMLREFAEARKPPKQEYLAETPQDVREWERIERRTRQAAAAGDWQAMVRLAAMQETAGDRDDAERLARQALDAGSARGLMLIAVIRGANGDRDGAERLARQALDAGFPDVLGRLALRWERAGDWDDAERLARPALDAGFIQGLGVLVRLRARGGDRDGAERLARFGLTAEGEDEAPWQLFPPRRCTTS